MRVCSNCGKSNLDTRKFCIRCGRSLLEKKTEVKRATAPVPAPETPEVGRVVTGATIKESRASEPPKPVDDGEEWVKPSEVSRDRVRSSSGSSRITEMEKARAAFERADKVGIEEDGTGVVETRMLRASEVKALMAGVHEMGTDAPPTEEEDDGMVMGPPPIAAPSPKDIETHLLGTKSAYVDQEQTPAHEEPIETLEGPEMTSPEAMSTGFASARYEKASDPVPAHSEHRTVIPTPEKETPIVMNDDERVTTCPSCGEVISIDMFEYPKEVYSAMGAARVKQARFFVVQGKYDEAQKTVRIARSLYIKANDSAGLAEVGKLVDSLARRN
jgi:hypothetical protein